MPGDGLRPILIVLIDGYADWETALISAHARQGHAMALRHATPGGGRVSSMGGLAGADLPDVVVQGDEVIVLCGGDGWAAGAAPALDPLLIAAHRRGQVIAAISGATLALARNGLLDRLRHTSDAAGFLAGHAPGYRGGDFYTDRPYAVRDRGIITAPGTAPVSFAAEVLAAAGLPANKVADFRKIMAREH
ncbi:DJ-1/PfpI family protein [Paracoccus sp. DMF-8]|uniref:DJ-1/PfpI family protein n=1 Tax=Paracoccus sp. DMF-8 TaxID=3019445 RepID=UPI0023E46228|nr:DJ-1/PfpI family protein [Paracoccus sp. DMF-8]MDF3607803.1 DJ-1/PfpI family protein [Paracoccus sp. DMF-8]